MEKENKKSANKKNLHVVALIGCILVVAGMVVAVLLNLLGSSSDKCTLYWNVEKDTYLSASGLSGRELEEDGYYHVLMAVDGEQIEYRVSDKDLVDKIDNYDVMGLEIDKDGVITDVMDPDDVTGGELVNRWYVTEVQSDKLVVSDAKSGSNLKYNLAITENTGIYDVTGEDPVGHSTTAQVGDCVRVFRDYEKEIIYVFIVKEDGVFAGNIVTRYCEHCKAEVEWYEWTETTTLPTTAGHWCLMDDVSLVIQQKIATDDEVVVDLNGKTVTGAVDRRVYYAGSDVAAAKLAILDQSAEKTGVLRASGYVQNGGVIFLKAGTLELYSGTIDASAIDTEYRGLALFIDADATCNMYGGTIIGGKTTCAGRAGNTSNLGGGGGSVYLNNRSTFTMYDGTIRDGKVYAMKNGDSYAWGIGGNIDVRSDATFIMEGGEILDGFAEKEGGNVYLSNDNAKFIMNDGVISGGSTSIKNGKGGNVYIAVKCNFEMNGGEIKDGTVVEAGGGNVMVYGTLTMNGGKISGGKSVSATGQKRTGVYHHNVYCANAHIEMTGGLIEGDVTIASSNKVNKSGTLIRSTVKLSGTAQIIGGERNLSIPNEFLLEVGTLEKGANISVYGRGFISEKTAKANLAYVHSDYEGVDVSYVDKKLFVGKMNCVCGGSHVDSNGTLVSGHYGECDGTVLEWWPWPSDTSIPTAKGNWYLTKDVVLTGQKGIAKDAKIALDLNGHTITGKEGKRMYYLGQDNNIQLAITDLSKNSGGKIVPVGKELPGAGAAMLVMGGNKVTMYDGIWDASKVSSKMAGTLLAIRSNASFTMYGGTMIGGTSLRKTDSKGKQTEGMAGTVLVQGEFKLYDGIIRDGNADYYGGNIYVNKGKLFIYGGKILNGTGSSGGNVNVNGECTMTGGLISGGNAAQGGNVQLLQKAVMNLKGGTIENGVASSYGGNINGWSNSNLKISGGTISNGEAVIRGGNVGITGYITMTGGTIKDGVVTLEEGCDTEKGVGGNVYVTGWSSTTDKVTTVYRGSLTMSGGTISGGNAVNGRGGNVYVTDKADMTLSDKGIVEKGVSSAGGGNIYIFDESTLTMKGGQVRDGKDGSSGGNIRLASKSELIMTGGEISNGQTTTTDKNTYGGNISDVATATMTLSGGRIINGSVARGMGGNIFSIGTIKLSNDVVIEGGNAGTGTGGNIGLNAETAVMTMDGGTIRGGVASTGYNVAVVNGSELTINQGTIEGGSQNGDSLNGSVRIATNAKDLILGTGVIKISGPNGGVYLDKERNITLKDQLNENTLIGITVNGDRVFAENAKDTYVKNFDADQQSKAVFFDEDKEALYIGVNSLTDEELASGVVFDLKNVSVGTKVASNAIALADRDKYSTINDEGKKLMFSEDGIVVVAEDAHVHCPCGDDTLTEGTCAKAGHYEVEYKELAAGENIKDGGNFYLSDDLLYTRGRQTTSNATINLCLNGHKMEFGNKVQRIMQMQNAGDVMTISGKCEYSTGDEKGSIVKESNGSVADHMGVFFLQKGASLNLYNMILDVESWIAPSRGDIKETATAILLQDSNLCTYGSTLIPAKTIGEANYECADKANRGVMAYGDYTWDNPEGLTGTVPNGEVHDLKDVAIGTVISTKKIPVAVREYHTTANSTGKKLMFSEEGIKVVAEDAHVHCVCGSESRTEGPCYEAGHYEIEFTALTAADEGKLKGKNVYLTENVTWTGGREQMSNGEHNVNLCLNGYTLTKQTNERLVQYNATATGTMNVVGKCEYSGTRNNGSIKGISATNKAQVGLLWIQGAVSLNLYDMTVDAESWSMVARDISAANVSKGQGNGAGILVQSGCTLRTYGSTIVPAKDFGANSGRTAYTNRGVFIYTGGTWINPEGLQGAVETGK